MTANDILLEVQRRRVELVADGERIIYHAPKGSLTPELREAIARHRNEILAVLTEPTREQQAETIPSCGSEKCGGCYEVSQGIFLHPPTSTANWNKWLRRWQPEKDRVQ